MIAGSRPTESLPLDAYPDRIGLGGRPDPAEVHRAHVTSIPRLLEERLRLTGCTRDPHGGVTLARAERMGPR